MERIEPASTRRDAGSGYDARSVLVLALVVAVLAAVVGWTMTLGREDGLPAASSSTTSSTRAESAGSAAVDASPAVDGSTVAAGAQGPAAGGEPVPAGVDLQPARILASRSATGVGLLRISVANRGSEDGDRAVGTQVLVLLDGVVVGERSLGGVDANGSASTELALDSCPAGGRALVVVVDPRGEVRELDERNNTSSSTVSFDC